MLDLELKDMSCGHCVHAVTRAIRELDADAKVDVDLGSKRVRVETSADAERVAAALIEAGYPPSR